jgi:hypothetical protein
MDHMRRGGLNVYYVHINCFPKLEVQHVMDALQESTFMTTTRSPILNALIVPLVNTQMHLIKFVQPVYQENTLPQLVYQPAPSAKVLL